MVALLLDLGAQINSRAIDGTTPLHCAAERASMPVVQLLLKRGAAVAAEPSAAPAARGSALHSLILGLPGSSAHEREPTGARSKPAAASHSRSTVPKKTPCSLRRALLTPQVSPGSLYRCGKST